jgi:hypothetical protein
MKTILTLTVLWGAVLASGAAVAAQQSGLVRIQPAVPADEQPIDLESWRERLRADDLDLREQSYDSAVQLARTDPRLRSALETWACDESDLQLAWTSRLLLREVERTPALWRVPGQPLGVPPLPQIGGMDSLFDSFFGGDPFALPGAVLPDASVLGNSHQMESLRLSTGPDGVRCTVIEMRNGERVEQTYEAATLEELLEQHPELRDRVQGAGAVQRGGGRFPARELRTDVLGVFVQPLGQAQAERLGIEPGVGLAVERVEGGTIAAALGLRRGHVLIECNGEQLCASEDLTRVLAARPPQGELRLVLVDPWGRTRTRVWKPSAFESKPGAVEQARF